MAARSRFGSDGSKPISQPIVGLGHLTVISGGDEGHSTKEPVDKSTCEQAAERDCQHGGCDLRGFVLHWR